MANESIGKVSLDLELNMDLAGQIDSVSGLLKKRLQNSLKGMFDNLFKSAKVPADKTADLYKRAMEKAASGTGKTTQNIMKRSSDMIRQTFDTAVVASKRSINVIGTNFRQMLQSVLSMAKSKMKTITPNEINLGSKMPKANVGAATVPRGPPTENPEILQSQMTTIERTMDNVEAKIRLHKQRLKELRESYANTFNTSTKNTIEDKMLREEGTILRLADKMETLNLKYGKMEERLRATAAAENQTGKATASLAGKMDLLKEKMVSTHRTGGKMPNLLSRISASLKKVSDRSKTSSVNVNSFGRGIKGTLGQMLKWMIVLPAIASAIKAMAQSLWQSLQTNDQFTNSLNQIRTNLLVAFTPIYQAILPALNSLMSMLSQVTAYMASFISQLFGKTYAASFQATQGLVAAKEAMGAYGTSASGAAKAAKDAQKQLMGFDQINKLQSPSTSDKSDAPTLVKPPDMSALDSATIPWVQKFKDIMSQVFQPFKDAWDMEGMGTIASMRGALSGIWDLVKSIGRSFLEVWTNGTGTQTLTLMLQILQGIFGLVGNIATGLEDAWNKNGTGTAIVQSLFNIFNSILTTIRNIVSDTADWAATLDFTPLLTSIQTLLQALEPFTQTIGEGLEWLWNNVLLPIAGWAITDAVPAFLNLLAGAIDAINVVIEVLEPLGVWLFDNFLEPLGEWAGDIFISAMETVTDLLHKFSDWCLNHQSTVQTLTILIGSLALGFGIVSVATTAWNIVCGIATTATTLLGAAFTFLTSPIGMITIIIAGVIAIGVLLYKNWDTIAAKAKEVWDFIKQKFEAFDKFLTLVFSVDWSKCFGSFGEVMNGFFATVKGIWDGIKKIFGGIVDFVKGVFSGNWKQAWEGVKQIFSGVMDTLGSIMKGPLNAVISLINAAIGGLNKISVDVPDWIPGLGGKTFGFNIPKIPYLAQGGIIDSPTLAMMGEQGKSEAVVPLERNLGWRDAIANKVVEKLGGTGGGSITADELRSIINAAVERIVSALEALAFYVDSEELATAIAKGAAKHDRRFNVF